MIKKYLIFLALFLWGKYLFSAPVTIEIATRVAQNWYYERGNITKGNFSIKEQFIESKGKDTLFYVFNFVPAGFVMISAEDVTIPVLGYSFVGEYTTENNPPAFDDMLASWKEQLIYAKQNSLKSTKQIASDWNRLNVAPTQFIKQKYGKDVSPLITTIWGQSTPYNSQCPTIGGQRCLVGCGAVAMAQVMKYHNHPSQGTSSNSYIQPNLDTTTVSANFNTTYDWANMPDSLVGADSTQINATAKLLFHIGVSMEMNYGLSLSSSYTSNIESALETYFCYHYSSALVNKDAYSDSLWKNMMRIELDNARPIIYFGSGSGGGHAFNMDGYQGSDYFHFNWGWKGSRDGNYYLDNLNPGGHDFTNDQYAVIGIKLATTTSEWTVYDTLNSGLPNNFVNALGIEGMTGDKWIGTNGGLVTFDGTNWTVYDTSNSGLPDNYVNTLGIQGNNIWVGTYDGLAKFDGANWTVYDTSNSDLPSNNVSVLTIGESNIWIGTSGSGLAKFDGTNWIVYDTINSDLPDNDVRSLAIEGTTGDVWVGTYWGGLAKFDGTNWTVFNTSNSGLPSNSVHSITAENGNIWVGGLGLAKFDGTNWTVFNTSNSGIPSNNVTTLAIEGTTGDKWIGTGGGLAKFDGTNWTVFNSSNSRLPHSYVRALAIEGSNIWIGTGKGLAVYSPIGVEEKSRELKGESIELKIGQNPFIKSTIIKYFIPVRTRVILSVYDISGSCLRTLANGEKEAGSYTTNLNSTELKTGIYFVRLTAGENKLTKKLVLMK
ncbi:MAG: C10 family peptidase [bacterium]|nr:C10 family peptidase [bacterium]